MGRPLPPLLRGGAPQARWIGASGRAFWAEPARRRPPQQRGEAERESAHAGRRGPGAIGKCAARKAGEHSGRSPREDARPNNGGRPSARALTPADGVWGHRSSAAPEGREQRTGPQNLLTPAKPVVT